MDSPSDEATSPPPVRPKGNTRLFSRPQLLGLRAAFSKQPYPNPSEYEQLAQSLGMLERSVRLWFQNMRSRARKRGPSAIHAPTRAEKAEILLKFNASTHDKTESIERNVTHSSPRLESPTNSVCSRTQSGQFKGERQAESSSTEAFVSMTSSILPLSHPFCHLTKSSGSFDAPVKSNYMPEDPQSAADSDSRSDDQPLDLSMKSADVQRCNPGDFKEAERTVNYRLPHPMLTYAGCLDSNFSGITFFHPMLLYNLNLNRNKTRDQ
ncbi:hypothetical protein CAPTEDRAFT_197329 [Capitella teleta]|uniref:Homeobox domain-containing protein n=1 Tax=Capitella teleta TaxID=283909 RepID=R7TPR7_CAPTE|nr:hypothetical protein CAPTEDRAFT_197329 [Capitella teleta]|eukprot:ELT95654.1 hypothetical protein CAPTEDRAFT_197329 [Capitella teleta]